MHIRYVEYRIWEQDIRVMACFR